MNVALPFSLHVCPFGALVTGDQRPRSLQVMPLEPTAPLWQLIVQLLPERDPETEWFTVAEIAPLVGLKPRSLLKHARDLWPHWRGQYRLNYGQACSLIRRCVYAGRKIPERAEVETRLKANSPQIQ